MRQILRRVWLDETSDAKRRATSGKHQKKMMLQTAAVIRGSILATRKTRRAFKLRRKLRVRAQRESLPLFKTSRQTGRASVGGRRVSSRAFSRAA